MGVANLPVSLLAAMLKWPFFYLALVIGAGLVVVIGALS